MNNFLTTATSITTAKTKGKNNAINKFVTYPALVLLVVLAGTFSTLVTAKTVKKQPQLSQFIAAKVQLAQQLQQQEEFHEAIRLLSELAPRQAYDQAVIHRVLGIFYWQNENIPQAVNYLSIAVESDLLGAQQARITQRMLADILLSQQQFAAALPHYYQLIKQVQLVKEHPLAKQDQLINQRSEDEAELWLRIGQAHYQLKQWPEVITAVKMYDTAANANLVKIADSTSLERKHVQALNLQLTAQSQLQLWPDAITTLQRILLVQPDKLRWWQQLAAIQLRIDQPQAALDSLILAQRQGLALSVQERKTLAQLYAQQGIPEKAALELKAILLEVKMLEETDVAELSGVTSSGVTSEGDRQKLLVTQAQYWQQAKEWVLAIQTWREVSLTTAQYRWSLAQLLLQQGYYQAALQELNNADITQGKNKSEIAQIELAKVRAYYKLAQFDQAIAHAKQAQYISPSASAKGWIAYLKQLRSNDYRS